MAVEGHAGVAGNLLDALQDLTGENFAQIALAQLRTLRVVVFIQLGILTKKNQCVQEYQDKKCFYFLTLFLYPSRIYLTGCPGRSKRQNSVIKKRKVVILCVFLNFCYCMFKLINVWFKVLMLVPSELQLLFNEK